MDAFFSFDLEQHTPILHFQYRQQGAGLRATEVKPKLDKFLWTGLNASERKDMLKNGAFRKADTGACFGNYKIRIHGKWERDPIDPGKRAKGYFGNMGAETEKKYLVYLKDVCIEFICFYPLLKEKIESHLADFFRTHNFGCRQNRGYGSFTLKGDRQPPSLAKYCFEVDENFYAGTKERSPELITMEAIDWFYKSLRQGINHGIFDKRKDKYNPFFYMKPMLFQYAASKGIQWEKKTIKKWFFEDVLEAQKDAYDPWPEDPLHSFGDKRLVRDLFGLSSDEAWMNYPTWGDRETSITKEDVTGNIERYPSPLTFKVIAGKKPNSMRVYFWNRELEDVYKRARFKIKENGDNNTYEPLQIWEGFDWDEFFEFAFDLDRLRKSMKLHDNRGRGVEKLLEKVYQDICKNNCQL